MISQTLNIAMTYTLTLFVTRYYTLNKMKDALLRKLYIGPVTQLSL